MPLIIIFAKCFCAVVGDYISKFKVDARYPLWFRVESFVVGDYISKFKVDEKLMDKDIDRKERLVQTYIVLYGLLISFGQNVSIQGNSSVQNGVNAFFVFLLAIVVYYVALSRITYYYMTDKISFAGTILIMEFCAAVASIYFGWGVVSYMAAVVPGATSFNANLVAAFLILVVWFSLSMVLFGKLYDIFFGFVGWILKKFVNKIH